MLSALLSSMGTCNVRPVLPQLPRIARSSCIMSTCSCNCSWRGCSRSWLPRRKQGWLKDSHPTQLYCQPCRLKGPTYRTVLQRDVEGHSSLACSVAATIKHDRDVHSIQLLQGQG